MKKNIISNYIKFFAVMLFAGCAKNFEQVNTNPTAPVSIDPAYLFATAEGNASTSSAAILYQGIIIQQHMNPYTGVAAAGNVNQYNSGVSGAIWDQEYNVNQSLAQVLALTKDDAARSNLYNMARIWKVYIFDILTDTYGDVPYSEAGLAYLKGIFQPKYDLQKNIYADMFNELDQAIGALDASKKIESNDIFYAGDITKWKKFGFSLMLRLAMRLVKVDATTAQTYAQKAFQGGVMQSTADDCYNLQTSAFNNPIGAGAFNSSEKANYYLCQTFVDSLKMNNNPLLGVIAVIYADPTQNVGETAEDTNPADQIGMPIGFDDQTISSAPNFPGAITAYSQVNRKTYGSITAPCYHLSFSQTQLLLSEAAYRGWITADPAALYVSGVAANMQQSAVYGATIDQSAIDSYIAAHPYNASRAIEQINTEYWISSFLNPNEAYANWRRTGFPNLAPNNYPNQSIPIGQTIRRLVYPNIEQSVNTVNYNAAIADQGPDLLNTRVYWDK